MKRQQSDVFRTVDAKGKQHELRLETNYKSVSPKRFLNTKTGDIFVENDFYANHKKGIYENIRMPNTNHICYKYPKSTVKTMYQNDFEKKQGKRSD